MKIINKVEINYFRSIYSMTLSDNNNVNIFVGGNDAGKSNLLKALNLFFNLRPDFDGRFEFLRDLCRLRETEARVAKGRATIWVRITFNNFLGWTSLPKKFTVKRTWNRYTDLPTDTYEHKTNPTIVAKFLNKIAFHYIPAVRSRDIFARYLQGLHDALIEDEKAGVRDSSTQLMEAINASTEDMSKRIQDGLGIESKIKVPEDLKELFSALDFSTVFSDYNIPLQLRGDGIQSRHIPFILDFIARHSKKHHIWAYEEPENSLEMSRAFELAKQFDLEFSKENQIYLTTHSPAFYDLSGAHVSKWLINSEVIGENRVGTTAEIIQAPDVADRRLGIAALIADRARELYEENKNLFTSVTDLTKQVEAASRAQVIVEGPTDKRILEAAFEKLYSEEEMRCDFVAANCASNVGSFVKVVSKMAMSSSVPIIGLVDNERAGRDEERAFKAYKHFNDSKFRTISQVQKIYFGMLPVPDQFAEVERILKQNAGDGFGIPLSIEFMLPPAVIQRAIAEEVLVLKDRVANARDAELALQVNLSENYRRLLPDGMGYFSKEIVDGCKNDFAAWVEGLGAEAFDNFKPLFELINEMSV